jgi:hypothetical protein
MTDQFANRAASFAAYITSLADVLEPRRRKLFLEWIYAHSGQIIKGSDQNCIRDSLTNWFESLSEADVLREYYLVISEINWWLNLKQAALNELEASELLVRPLASKENIDHV